MVKVLPFSGYTCNPSVAQDLLCLDISNDDTARSIISSNQVHNRNSSLILSKIINRHFFFWVLRSFLTKQKTFLRVIRPESDKPLPGASRYEHGKLNLEEFIKNNYLEKDDQERVYIYAETSNGKRQVGIVCASSIVDYEENRIKKHEATLKSRVESLTKTCIAQNANTGLIFLFHKTNESINKAVNDSFAQAKSVFDLVTPDDGVRHQLWKADADHSKEICKIFGEKVDCTYIADGHHRTESALNLAKTKRQQALLEGKELTGEEPFNYFMSVIYPEEQLSIDTFPRLIYKDPSFKEDEVLKKLQEEFEVTKMVHDRDSCSKGTLALLLKGQWFLLREKEKNWKSSSLDRLDVQVITDKIIRPVLSTYLSDFSFNSPTGFGLLEIEDLTTDPRIDFIPSSIGTMEYLEKRCSDDCFAAIIYSTVLTKEISEVADEGGVMPPKSTCFLPKPRSGAVVRFLN